MPLPKIYAHIAPDGRLLDARDVPPVSWETIGGKIHEYIPADSWMMSDQPGFLPPEAGRPVAVKVLTMEWGTEVPIQARYAAYLSFTERAGWGLWGWKYLEP